MKHHASKSFWDNFNKLPESVKQVANKNFEQLKKNSNHPSLHFKKIENYVSVRIGIQYRALGINVEDGILWFWIGSHSEYDKIFG